MVGMDDCHHRSGVGRLGKGVLGCIGVHLGPAVTGQEDKQQGREHHGREGEASKRGHEMFLGVCEFRSPVRPGRGTDHGTGSCSESVTEGRSPYEHGRHQQHHGRDSELDRGGAPHGGRTLDRRQQGRKALPVHSTEAQHAEDQAHLE